VKSSAAGSSRGGGGWLANGVGGGGSSCVDGDGPTSFLVSSPTRRGDGGGEAQEHFLGDGGVNPLDLHARAGDGPSWENL
jgi:hypothetical protein